MRNRITIKGFTCLLVSLAMLLSACSLKQDGEESGESAELIINENNTVFRFAAEEAGTLLPVCAMPQSLADAIGIIYEPLYDFDERLNVIPVLAEGCTRAGDTQYKVDLKKGVKWHDGTEFTASDVIYTVNALKKGESVYSADVDNIKEVDVINRHKLLFTLERPTVNFEGVLSFPIIKRNTDIENGGESVPVGTGPYKYSEKRNNTYYFKRNEEWHGGEASDKTVTITLLKDKQAVLYAYEANEADVISGSIVDLGGSTSKSNTEEYTTRKLTFLGMNDTEGILSLAEVRRAIAYLIDKEDIVRRNVYGNGESADIPVCKDAWFYDSNLGKVEVNSDGRYLESVLNENGWYKKNGIYTKDFGSYESELVLSILVNSENEEKTAVAESIAGILKSNGIIVKVKATPYEKYLGKIKDRDYSMFIGETAVSKNMDPGRLVRGGENYFGYESEEMDAVLAKMYSAREADEVISAYGEFSGVFLKDMPFVPLYFRKEAMVCKSNLMGYGKPNYYRPYKNIENWYFSQKVE